MPPTAAPVLSLAALLLAATALLIAIMVARRTTRAGASAPTPTPAPAHTPAPSAARVRAGNPTAPDPTARNPTAPDPTAPDPTAPDPTALRHVAVVRYDAFSDVGGRLSYSMAVVDDTASGFVLTTLAGKSDVRTYVRAISGGGCDGTLTDEEQQAIIAAVGSRP